MAEGGRINGEVASAAFNNALSTHEQSFEKFFLARLFGLSFAYEEDACTVSLEVKDFMFNPQGTLHGGVICMILDISMGHLLKRVTGVGATLEMKVQFMRPVGEGRVKCRAAFNKGGANLNYLEARLTDERGQLCAMGTSTWLVKQPPTNRRSQTQ
jgi:uncharacterized protein (TIGR00369 family)